MNRAYGTRLLSVTGGRSLVGATAGTELVLEKAIQYTNGVSGMSTPYIFGTIGSREETYSVGYQWGKRDLAKSHYGVEECWKFHQAPWQAKPDTTFYALPVAEWW